MAASFPFSLNQLQRFLTVAEELHFTRAAARLNLSQPLLSAQVRDLERALGAQLFERSSRKVTLTPAGIFLRERLQSTFSGLQDAIAAMKEIASGSTAPIRIGYTDEFTNYIVPELVTVLKQDERAEVILTSGAVPQLTAALSEAEADLIFLCPLPTTIDPDWCVQSLPASPLVVGVHRDHSLAGQKCLTIEQLAKEPFIASTFETAGSELLADRLFAAKGLHRLIGQRADDPHLMNSLAAAGAGILLATAEDFATYPSLVSVPLYPAVSLSRGAVSRRSNQSALLRRAHEWLQLRIEDRQ